MASRTQNSTKEMTIFEKRTVTNITRNIEMYERLCPSNQKLIADFLQYLTMNNYSYVTCLAMKSSIIKFFQWNLDYNKDTTFYTLCKIHFTRFFEYCMFVENTTYDRTTIIKSHLSTLSEFCEHCLGMRKFNRNRNNQPKGNKWFKYKNIVQYVEVPMKPKKTTDSNIDTIAEKDIERLKWYIIETKQWDAYVVLYYAHMGIKILDLTIDDIMETGDAYCKKWVRYLDKYGLPFKNAMVFQEEYNVWRLMTHEDILSYEEFFSYFIGKKVIICNEYSTRIYNT